MSKREDTSKVAPGAIHVEAVRTVQGPAATTISVEVEEARLGQSGDGANDARRAVAMLPSRHEGQEDTEQVLMESGRRMTEDERVVKTFNATVPGAVDVRESRVKVETPAGTVWAHDADSPRAARDADKSTSAKPKRS
jgi:hypothetical protein